MTTPWMRGYSRTPASLVTLRSPARWARRRILQPWWTSIATWHGLQSLRVVDAAVMPDIVRANTNATIIMMAERVADFIKEGR